MIRDLAFYHNDIIKDIAELVKIPTVYDAATITDAAPYGKYVREGYDWLKKKALTDGFEVLEYDGHALAIRIKDNTGNKRIDVVSHVDVVEPGEGWSDSPFCGRITEEYIYGRGTQDMKGTLIITYYALKYIKDNRIPCKNELRVVFGCDEERTMEDIRYYVKKAGEPDFAFTPDGQFPFSLGEKGALMWCLEGSTETCIKEFDGGVQCNVVSPIACAVVKDVANFQVYQEQIAKGYQGNVITEQDSLRITIYGQASHASRPEDGINASVLLLKLISLVSKDTLANLLYQCFYDYYGKGAGIHYNNEKTGRLTFNLGIIKIKNHKLSTQIDCRYPYGLSSITLTEKLQKALNPITVTNKPQKALKPITVTLAYDDKPTLSDLNSPYIQMLLHTYREITNDTDSEPFISGGVTYSKAIGNCVAFGPGMKDDFHLAHQADERINISKIDKLFEVYTQTMIRLANL